MASGDSVTRVATRAGACGILGMLCAIGCSGGDKTEDVADTGGGFVVDVGNPGGCDAGVTTTISGTVVSPGLVNPDPIYNAVVFVPKGELEPMHKGVSCDRCGLLEGTKAKTIALTGPDGKFKLDNVTPGENVPLVVQIGRWRKQYIIPKVNACVDNPMTADHTRLPRNKSEGDIPFTAIVMGHADPLECVLRKMGIDDAEFTEPLEGKGRIHLFRSLNGPDMPGGGTISGHSLWKDVEWMKRYDMVLLPCEGSDATADKAASDMQNVVDYTAAGGRVFTTHYGYTWLKNNPDAGWQNSAKWTAETTFTTDLTGVVNQSFPKGKAMAEWLKIVGASTTPGEIKISDPRVDANDVGPGAQSWITSKTPVSAQHFTFNTPVGKPAAEQCGRVVYSDFHVVPGDDGTHIWPTQCSSGPLTAQERVIEFMLFDLASCVQKEDDTPKPPA